MDCVDTVSRGGVDDLNSALGRMRLNNLNNNANDITMVDGDVNEETMETTENDMADEAVRLSTFTAWPHYAPVMPSALARAGFFYTGQRDVVECFSCKSRIQDWEHGDTAMGEHKKLFPGCLFVQGKDTRNKRLLSAPVVKQEAKPPRKQLLLSPNQMESGSDVAQQQLACALEHELQIKESQANHENRNAVVDDSMKTLRWEQKRLRTFADWPRNSPIHPEDLAKAGFYYLGSGDQVQCVFCRGILNNWRDTDDPMGEHREHFPSCRFILGLNCDNEPIRQYEEGRQRTLKLPVRVSEGDDEEATTSTEETLNHNTHVPEQTASVSPRTSSTTPCAHPEYREVKRRLSTYHTWPEHANAQPDALAQAGFYYTGIGDNVKCFHCDGGLRNWEPQDEPWAEHAKWFPRCQYLLKKRGQAYVDFVNSSQHAMCIPNEQEPVYDECRENLGDICEVPPLSNVTVPVSPVDEEMPRLLRPGKYEIMLEEAMSSGQVRVVLEMGYDRDIVQRVVRSRMEYTQTLPSTQEILYGVWDLEKAPHERQDRSDEFSHVAEGERARERAAQVAQGTGAAATEAEKVEELLEEKKCKICMDKDRCILFQPCGHLVVCEVCSSKLRKCPFCRKGIRSAIRAYLA